MTATATKPEKATTSVDVVEQLGRAERELANLEIEAEELVGKMRQAGYDGDAPAIVKHRQRASELPLFVQAAKIRVERLRITRLEALMDEAEAKLPSLQDAAEPLRKRVEEATQALREATGAASMVGADIYSWRMQISQHKRNLMALQGQVANGGTV